MSERTTLDEASRSRRTLTASPTMRARLGLVEAPPDETAATVEAISVTTEEKAERRAAVREVETLLRERWPVVFWRAAGAVGDRDPQAGDRGRRRRHQPGGARPVHALVGAVPGLSRRGRPRKVTALDSRAGCR